MAELPIEYIFAGLALLLAIPIGVSEWRSSRKVDAWFTGATRTQGVVSRIHVVERTSSTATIDTSYTTEIPIVRFRAANKVDYEFNADAPVGKVGSVVEVAYNPALPSDAKVFQKR